MLVRCYSVVFDIVLVTVNDFLDYAMIVVILLIVYYIFRFFLTFSSSSEEKETGGKIDLLQKAKDYRNKQKRQEIMGRSKGLLAHSIENLGHISDDLGHKTSHGLGSAKSRLESVRRNFGAIKRRFAQAQNHLTGEQRTNLGKWYNYIESMEDGLRNHILNKLPSSHLDEDWNNKVSTVRNNLRTLREECGLVMNAIDEFVENDQVISDLKREVAASGGASGGSQPGQGAGGRQPQADPQRQATGARPVAEVRRGS